MNDFLTNQFDEVKDIDYIISIPIEEFSSLEELVEFVKESKDHNVGVLMQYETSNFHNGADVSIFDKASVSDDVLEIKTRNY